MRSVKTIVLMVPDENGRSLFEIAQAPYRWVMYQDNSEAAFFRLGAARHNGRGARERDRWPANASSRVVKSYSQYYC
jgi:hypothetical protein